MQSSVDLALVSMPWALFNRPSIQLGVLKRYLDEHSSATINSSSLHPYLGLARSLGLPLYRAISTNVWLCEGLYAALLFPERREAILHLLRRELKSAAFAGVSVDDLCRCVADHLQRWVEAIDWDRYDLIGFSVCFNQLFATLAAVRQIQQRAARIPVVLGGSSCHAGVAPALYRHFGVQFMVSGEGEQPLLSLCEHLIDSTKGLHARVHVRGENGRDRDAPSSQLLARELPVPDYDDYFREMAALFRGTPFIPELPVEFSRGCWWRRCSFCNLNLQWRGYRFKDTEAMAAEIALLSRRHATLDFTFADNALPPAQALAFFDQMAESGRDLRFFAEIRADFRGASLSRSRRGGLASVQVGIEALSDSLLATFAKGTTVFDNIMVMRDAAAAGTVLEGNLIIEFPGSSEREVEETLAALDFVFPFHPLSTASFFLGLNSPVDCHPERYAIRARTLHPAMRVMLPEHIAADFPFLIKGFRADRRRQRALWKPVVHKVRQWREMHDRHGDRVPFLSIRDGGDFLIIRQLRPDGEILHHRLQGTSRRIYLSCEQVIDFESLCGRFPAVQGNKIKQFLADLVGKRLLFRQGDRFLALACKDVLRSGQQDHRP